MKTEELPYQIIEARDTRDVSTHVKLKGGEMKKAGLHVLLVFTYMWCSHMCAQICTCTHNAHDFQAVNFSLSEPHTKARHAANTTSFYGHNKLKHKQKLPTRATGNTLAWKQDYQVSLSTT